MQVAIIFFFFQRDWRASQDRGRQQGSGEDGGVETLFGKNSTAFSADTDIDVSFW